MLLLVTAVDYKMSVSVNVDLILSNLDNRSHCKPMNTVTQPVMDR